MSVNQQVIKRYKIILRILSRGGEYSMLFFHTACVNSGIEVKKRTVQKDLQNLRDDETIFSQPLNIFYDKKSKKWYSTGIPKSIYSVIELEKEEISALLFYIKTLKQYSGYPIFQEMSQAMKKIIENSNISVEAKRLFEANNLLETEKHQPIKGIKFITEILDAVNKRKVLKVAYQSFYRNEIKTYKIKPLLLKEMKQIWYIIGEEIDGSKIRTLALDRVNSLDILDEFFEPIEFDSEKYFKYSFGVTVEKEEPKEVIVSFTPFQGNYLRMLPIHSTQKILLDNEEEFRVQFTVIPSYEFYSKIRSYGEAAKIISPDYIVEEIQKSLLKASERYNSK